MSAITMNFGDSTSDLVFLGEYCNSFHCHAMHIDVTTKSWKVHLKEIVHKLYKIILN